VTALTIRTCPSTDQGVCLLDEMDSRLANGRTYLFGEQLTETDIRLFVTLVRFDAAYHGPRPVQV